MVLSGANKKHRETTSLNAQLAGQQELFMQSSRNLRQAAWLFIDKEFVECLIATSVNVCSNNVFEILTMSKIAMLHFSDMLIYISCKIKYVIWDFCFLHLTKSPCDTTDCIHLRNNRKLYLKAITVNFVPPMIDGMVLKDFLKRNMWQHTSQLK